MNIHSAYVTV